MVRNAYHNKFWNALFNLKNDLAPIIFSQPHTHQLQKRTFLIINFKYLKQMLMKNLILNKKNRTYVFNIKFICINVMLLIFMFSLHAQSVVNCPVNHILPNVFFVENTNINVEDKITSAAIHINASDNFYKAGEEIELINGFEVIGSSSFTGIIDDDCQLGGGSIDCGFSQLSADGLPTMFWMLEDGIDAYADYDQNYYYTFGSLWLSADTFLCGDLRRKHVAWDIHRANIAENMVGKEVYAVYDGIVKSVYNAGTNIGQGIVLEHVSQTGQYFTSTYIHIDPLPNLIGSSVTTGQLIGYVTDLLYNDHLHFGIRKAPYALNISERGALPNNELNSCVCDGDPVFPEYFIDPGDLSYYDQGSVIALAGDLDFGEVPIDCAEYKTLTISNLGNTDLDITNVLFSSIGYGCEADQPNPVCWGLNIPAYQSADVQIRFDPQDLINYSGTLTINSNALSGNNIMPIEGIGIDSKEINLGNASTGITFFGLIPVGQNSGTYLHIANNGTIPLNVTSIDLPHPDFYFDPGFSQNFLIPATNGSDVTSVWINFTPTIATTYNGIITVNSDADCGNNTVSITVTSIY